VESNFLQISILALIQGLTEFLPISSSAHLQLPALLLGWSDQGLAFDVAVHLGTLLAVVSYFHRDLLSLLKSFLLQILARPCDERQQREARLAWLLIMASIPAAVAGVLLYDLVAVYGRNAQLIALSSIVFALLLWWVDGRSSHARSMDDWNWRSALVVGLAQIFALLPGTSRSGVTMTAALQCGFSREASARFSFLLAIPIILGSGGLLVLDVLQGSELELSWSLLLYAALLAGLMALACIHYFLRLITRLGYLPFVIYRVVLGAAILLVA
jgi:undecaprenyl-diphosphatase